MSANVTFMVASELELVYASEDLKLNMVKSGWSCFSEWKAILASLQERLTSYLYAINPIKRIIVRILSTKLYLVEDEEKHHDFHRHFCVGVLCDNTQELSGRHFPISR